MFLTQVCQYLRNWFDRDRLVGEFVVQNGAISYANGIALPLQTGQYYRIMGSVFNDGVHKDGEGFLHDEDKFSGAVWSMAIPPDFLALVAEIETWVQDNAAIINSPYTSESFGGYSYSLRTGYGNGGNTSGGATWQSQFSSRLNPWRKI